MGDIYREEQHPEGQQIQPIRRTYPLHVYVECDGASIKWGKAAHSDMQVKIGIGRENGTHFIATTCIAIRDDEEKTVTIKVTLDGESLTRTLDAR